TGFQCENFPKDHPRFQRKNILNICSLSLTLYSLINSIRKMELYEELQHVEIESKFITAYDFEVYDIYRQKFMKDRPAYKLTLPLFFWNLGLTIFSIICTVRGLPESLFHLWKPDGVYSAVCVARPHNYATSFWFLMFFLSKFLELGDTAFIVLRKQKLIPLHWFHHAATVSICWAGYEYYETTARIAFINVFVHSFMYFYYALKALKVKIPKKASQVLTTLQIAQLSFLLYGGYSISYYVVQGRSCRMNTETLILGGSVIGIFLALFMQFYLKSYLSAGKRKKQ
ncbi:unnamed protein product, partial [Allacma fusca]